MIDYQINVVPRKKSQPLNILWFGLSIVLSMILFVAVWFIIQTELDYGDKENLKHRRNYTHFQKLEGHSSSTAIVYIHGGAFFAGNAASSISWLQKISDELSMPVYSLKYPLRTTARLVLYDLLASLLQIREPNIVVIGSSAGAFWGLSLLLLLSCEAFRKGYNIPLNHTVPTVRAFVSLCGVLNSDYNQTIFKISLNTGSFIGSVTHGQILNPLNYVEALDSLPVLLIDTNNGRLNFVDHIKDVYQQRVLRTTNETQLVIMSRLPHTFVFQNRPESQQVFKLICLFVEKYGRRGGGEEEIKTTTYNFNFNKFMCDKLQHNFNLGNYSVSCSASGQ